MAYDQTAAGLPVRVPGADLAAAEARDAERIIAERDTEIADQVQNETPKGGLY